MEIYSSISPPDSLLNCEIKIPIHKILTTGFFILLFIIIFPLLEGLIGVIENLLNVKAVWQCGMENGNQVMCSFVCGFGFLS
jgi:hypothetical protein